MSCRVLSTDYKITYNYQTHYNLVINKRIGWAIGTDIIGVDGICDVIAHSDGTVIKVIDYMDGTNKIPDREGWGFGNYVMLLHGRRSDGKWLVTEYCHLATVHPLSTGQFVKKGEVLGIVGNTGTAYGAHLHFSYRIYTQKPTPYTIHNKKYFFWENPEHYLNSDLPLVPEESANTYANYAPGSRMYYRVRKAWEEPASQLGAFIIYQNAVSLCQRYQGYSVFDKEGNRIYGS